MNQYSRKLLLLILSLAFLLFVGYEVTKNRQNNTIIIGGHKLIFNESEAYFFVEAFSQETSGSLVEWFLAEVEWREHADSDALRIATHGTTFLFHIQNDRIDFVSESPLPYPLIYPDKKMAFVTSKLEEKKVVYKFENGQFGQVDLEWDEVRKSNNVGYVGFLNEIGWSFDPLHSLVYENGTASSRVIPNTNSVVEFTNLDKPTVGEYVRAFKVVAPNGFSLNLSIHPDGKWVLSDGKNVVSSGSLL